MNRTLMFWASITVALASCAGVDGPRRDLEARVQATLAQRAGVQPPPGDTGTDGAISEAVDDLLAGELTEENAVRIALLNNRAVRAGYERLGVAASDLVRAGLLRNPVFGAEALFSSGGTEVALGLAQPFVDLFWRPLRRRAAEHEVDAVVASVTRDLLRLTFSVRRGFVRVRATQQLVETQRRVLAAATASHELMQQLAAAGNVVSAQLSATRIAEGRARLGLAAAERAALEAREPLHVLLGLWGSRVAWRIDGALPGSALAGVELADVESRSIAASLELREVRARIDAAAQGADIRSWSRWLPDASLGVDARREPGGAWGLGPGLTGELPVFDTGAAASDAAQARVRSLLHRHVQLAVEIRAAARVLRERVDLLDQRLRFLQHEFLPAQERLLHDTLQNYNAMQIGAFDVLTQKQRQLAAVRELALATRDAWLARLDLDELLAGSQPPGALTPFFPQSDNPDDDASDRGGH